MNWIPNILFALLSACSLFVNYDSFNDTQNLPKWLFTLFIAGFWGMAYAVKTLMYSSAKKGCIDGYIIIIIASCSLQSLYSFYQIVEAIMYSYIGQKQMCGSFDTVSGFAGCLSAGIPLFLIKMEGKSYIHRTIKILFLISIAAIFISKSRSGIISVSFVLIYWAIFKNQISRKLLYISIGCLILLFAGCYLLKKDSADGRLLIWHCCWEMIKDKPLLGHGPKAFELHYMDYQAEFFSQNSKGRFALLADNVKHTYNIILLLGIQFGIIGLILFFLLILLVRHCYRKNQSLNARAAILSLISIGIFDCFSYSLMYIFIWVVILLDIFIIIHEAYPLIVLKNRFIRLFIFIFFSGASSFLIHKVYVRTCAELEWNEIANYARKGQMLEVSQRYETLMTSLGENPKFLYNYAAELYMIDKYEKSMNIAKQCRKYNADYNLELLIALNAIKINCPKEAESFLWSAFFMCPNRFVPLFELSKLYERSNEIDKALEVANMILHKKIKIDSPTIHSIKIEMRSLIERHRTKKRRNESALKSGIF